MFQNLHLFSLSVIYILDVLAVPLINFLLSVLTQILKEVIMISLSCLKQFQIQDIFSLQVNDQKNLSNSSNFWVVLAGLLQICLPRLSSVTSGYMWMLSGLEGACLSPVMDVHPNRQEQSRRLNKIQLNDLGFGRSLDPCLSWKLTPKRYWTISCILECRALGCLLATQ